MSSSESSLHVLMIGKGGVGKSSLANAILDSQVCPVAEQPGDDVEHYTTVVDKVAVHVYDTRGLLDGEKEVKDIAQVIKKIGCQFDIVIACIKFNDRFDLSNRMIFDVISRLGSDVWPKVCVALTHSDITPADWPRYEIDKRFSSVLKQWEDAISTYLTEKHQAPVQVFPTSHTQVAISIRPLKDWLTVLKRKLGDLHSCLKPMPKFNLLWIVLYLWSIIRLIAGWCMNSMWRLCHTCASKAVVWVPALFKWCFVTIFRIMAYFIKSAVHFICCKARRNK